MPKIISEPVRFDTVQLPSGGKPFILMSEHQTTGGYPRILEVISAARPLLAQASPERESRIVFLPVDFAQVKERSALSLKDQLRIRTALKEKLGW
jgi:allophanate hydrolase subunit 2